MSDPQHIDKLLADLEPRFDAIEAEYAAHADDDDEDMSIYLGMWMDEDMGQRMLDAWDAYDEGGCCDGHLLEVFWPFLEPLTHLLRCMLDEPSSGGE